MYIGSIDIIRPRTARRRSNHVRGAGDKGPPDVLGRRSRLVNRVLRRSRARPVPPERQKKPPPVSAGSGRRPVQKQRWCTCVAVSGRETACGAGPGPRPRTKVLCSRREGTRREVRPWSATDVVGTEAALLVELLVGHRFQRPQRGLDGQVEVVYTIPCEMHVSPVLNHRRPSGPEA